MRNHGEIFFCENCGINRISTQHTIRITKHGSEIVQDTCETCGATQQIEFFSNADDKKQFRVTDNPDSQIK